MSPIKIARAFLRAVVFQGTQTRAHILRNIEPDSAALKDLTSAQLAAVINIANRSYHDGRLNNGGIELLDGDLWIGQDVNKLIPMDALRALTITETHEDRPIRPQPGWPSTLRHTTRIYTMQYQEQS